MCIGNAASFETSVRRDRNVTSDLPNVKTEFEKSAWSPVLAHVPSKSLLHVECVQSVWPAAGFPHTPSVPSQKRCNENAKLMQFECVFHLIWSTKASHKNGNRHHFARLRGIRGSCIQGAWRCFHASVFTRIWVIWERNEKQWHCSRTGQDTDLCFKCKANSKKLRVWGKLREVSQVAILLHIADKTYGYINMCIWYCIYIYIYVQESTLLCFRTPG